MPKQDNNCKPESFYGSTRNFAISLLQIIGVIIILRTLFFEPFFIPSGSMRPNLLIGDYIITTKYDYGYSQYSLPFAPISFKGRIFNSAPERGDVAVFRLPSDPSINYVKRIIGLPGDKVQVRDNMVYINDKPIERKLVKPYLYGRSAIKNYMVPQYIETLPSNRKFAVIEQKHNKGFLDNTKPFYVPKEHYFAIGDNRDNSNDSRANVGFIPKENLIGEVAFVLFSINLNANFYEMWRFIRWDRFIHFVS